MPGRRCTDSGGRRRATLNMFVGIVGGVGSGMWSMLLKILLAVFAAGLMIAGHRSSSGRRSRDER